MSDTVLNELLDDLVCTSSAPELYQELVFGHGGTANREGWHLQQQQQQQHQQYPQLHQQQEQLETSITAISGATMGNQQQLLLVEAPIGSDSCATGEQLETPQTGEYHLPTFLMTLDSIDLK